MTLLQLDYLVYDFSNFIDGTSVEIGLTIHQEWTLLLSRSLARKEAAKIGFTAESRRAAPACGDRGAPPKG